MSSIIPDYKSQPIPALKPVLFFNLRAEEPTAVFSNETQTQSYVALNGGFVKSLDENLPFDAKIVHGKDDITFRADSPNVGRLDCNLYLEFEDGATGLVEYTGVVRFEDKVAAVAGGNATTMSFEDGYVTNHPVFKLSDKSRKEAWVRNVNFLGKGRFVRDENNVLHVQYYVYTFA